MMTLSDAVLELELDAYVRGESALKTIRLRDYAGSWVALFFYPRDFTFVCPTEIAAFADLHREFAAEGAVLLGASTDSYHSHRAWFETDMRLSGVNFPVLADTSHRLSRELGVLRDDGTALRATFLVDPERAIRHASLTDGEVGRAPAETLRVLQAFATGELCPVAWRPGEPTLTQTLALAS